MSISWSSTRCEAALEPLCDELTIRVRAPIEPHRRGVASMHTDQRRLRDTSTTAIVWRWH